MLYFIYIFAWKWAGLVTMVTASLSSLVDAEMRSVR